MQKQTPERIYHWLDSQLSIARHYGGCRFNGVEYVIAYNEEGQPLVRKDLLKKPKAAKQAARAANRRHTMGKGEIDKLRALAEKATPGPWRARGSQSHGTTVDGAGITQVPVAWCSIASTVGLNGSHSITTEEAEANAALIASMRNAMPELLDTIDTLAAEGMALAQALEGMLAIVNDSSGVYGYHLNGEGAEWGEFEEVSHAESVLAKWEKRMPLPPEPQGVGGE